MITPSLFPAADPLQLRGPRLELRLPARWIFRMPRALKTPNASIFAGRWAMQRVRQDWERELAVTVATFATVQNARGWSADERQAYAQLRAQREKRAIRIWRLVPSSRNFLQDPDNLDFAAKQLVDAMKLQGLVHNDNYTWLERARTQEAISGDGNFWTVVQLDRPDVRRAWRG